MPIDIKVHEDDYILYEIICDYCDKEYTIKYMLEEGEKKEEGYHKLELEESDPFWF